MLTALKLSLIHAIEASILLPAKGFFVKNETSIRMCYSVDKKMKYIYLPTPIDVAKFFLRHGKIHSYTIAADKVTVTMYGQTLLTITGDRGEPVQYERLVSTTWDDLDLGSGEVQWFCAYHEFELQNKLIGNVFDFLHVA